MLDCWESGIPLSDRSDGSSDSGGNHWISPEGTEGRVAGSTGVAGGRRRLQGDAVAGAFDSLFLVSSCPWSGDDSRERRSGFASLEALGLAVELG